MDSTEAQKFLAPHEILYQFLIGRIYNRVGGEPEEIAAFVGKSYPEFATDLIVDGRSLLKKSPLPWQAISVSANYMFKNEKEAFEWLKNLLNKIEENLPKL